MTESEESRAHQSSADLKRTRRQRAAHQRGIADRLPPHAPEAEQGVLGCILLSPKDCLGSCIERLKAGAEAFYDLRHQTIFTTMVEMYEAREEIDIITLQQRLKDRQLLDQIGGISYLNTLQDCVPSAANLSYYLDIVNEKFLLRKTIQTCTDVVGRVFDHEGAVDELLDEVERDINAIGDLRVVENDRTIKSLTQGAIRQIEELHASQGRIIGIETGLTDLDKLTRGFNPGDFIILAARPSMGKTSLAMQIAEHAAVNNRIPVAVFSLEMTAESLALRALCSLARVNLRNVAEGYLAERDFPRLTGAAGKMSNAPLYIDDTPGLSILQLRARARRMVQKHGIKLIVADYLQLLHSTNRRAENRQQEITDISQGLKGIAKELRVPVIVASQLNREVEGRPDGKPRLSDLRESGAIEQDADIVGLLYKPKSKDEEEDSDCVATNLLIAKHRNGPTGEVHLTFLKSLTRFESAARVSDDGVPMIKSQSNDP